MFFSKGLQFCIRTFLKLFYSLQYKIHYYSWLMIFLGDTRCTVLELFRFKDYLLLQFVSKTQAVIFSYLKAIYQQSLKAKKTIANPRTNSFIYLCPECYNYSTLKHLGRHRPYLRSTCLPVCQQGPTSKHTRLADVAPPSHTDMLHWPGPCYVEEMTWW